MIIKGERLHLVIFTIDAVYTWKYGGPPILNTISLWPQNTVLGSRSIQVLGPAHSARRIPTSMETTPSQRASSVVIELAVMTA